MPKWTDEQEIAIDKDGTNIIVSAGAGSGKTAVLTERVYRKLKKGVKINELLILTFTKKAAGEMKERIRSKITEDDSIKDNLELIDSSYITTFDSYALSIVKKYNYLLNVSKDINIIDSSVLYLIKKRYLEEILLDLYEKKDSDFLKLVRDFTVKNDNDIKDCVLSINSKLDLKYNKKEYLDNYINNYYDDKYIDKLFDIYMDLITNKKRDINSKLTLLSGYVDTDYFNELMDSMNDFINSNTYDEYKSNADVKLPNLPRGSEEEAKDIKKDISDSLASVKDLVRFDSSIDAKEIFKSTSSYVKAIINIIHRLDEKIEAYKDDKGYYEFTDISKMAIRVLKENSEVKDELKYFYNEIMIDEYQDTSDLQEEFVNMIDNNNVYMVGDIKQSIYRFRNANPYLFKDKYDRYSNNDGGFKIDLTNNFRSREEIVKDINTIFSSIMTDKVGGADYIKSHIMNYGNKKYIEEGKTDQNYFMDIYNYEYDKNMPYTKQEIEIFFVAKDIKEKINSHYKIFDKKTEKLRDATYNDFVILLDKSNNFDLYKKIFEYLEIPLTKYSTTNMLDEVEALLIKNILKIFISLRNKEFDSEFKYSLVSVLRSYLFSYSDEDIFEMFRDNIFLDNDAVKLVNKISKDIDAISLNELINQIITEFDFYNKIVLVGDVDNRVKRLDEIENLFSSLSSLGYDLFSAYDYLKDIIEDGFGIEIKDNSSQASSVKIMTIHASKGLEFPVCYFSMLDSKFNISELNEKFMYSNRYGILSPYFKEGIGTTFVKNLIKEDYLNEEISEKIRLFYVALTRAKEKMVLITSFDKEKNSILDSRCFLDMLTLIKDDINKYIKNIDINSLGITKDYNLIKEGNYKDSIKNTDKVINIREFEKEVKEEKYKRASKDIKGMITKEEKEKMIFGTKIHELLEYIDFKNPDYSSVDSKYRDSIKYLIDNIDIDDAINIYKEYEFLYYKDDVKHHGIIDLLLEYDDKYKIIDYKLKNIDDVEYKEQLNEYRKYIESKTNKKIETYLYSIIDKEIRLIK